MEDETVKEKKDSLIYFLCVILLLLDWILNKLLENDAIDIYLLFA